MTTRETKILTCVEEKCGKDFEWPVYEQEFFEKNGYEAPKRCHNCRAFRRKQKGKVEGQ